MPKTYSLYLNDALAEKAQQFVSRLETVDFDSSGALFDNFIGTPDISNVELIDENGTSISLPSLQNTYTGSTVTISVSYTHLDVYKRQSSSCLADIFRTAAFRPRFCNSRILSGCATWSTTPPMCIWRIPASMLRSRFWKV